MKRSGPPKRKVGLKPGGPLRRSTKRMRYYSKKRAKRNREVAPKRRAYLESHPRCAIFPELPSTEVHEITAGPDRERALDVPAALLAVSRLGHRVVQHEPVDRQCARKLLATPDEFDLREINRLMAPKDHPDPPQAVEMADVVKHLELIGKERFAA